MLCASTCIRETEMSPSESLSDQAVNSLPLRLLPDTSPKECRRRSRQALKRIPEGESSVEKRLISAMAPPLDHIGCMTARSKPPYGVGPVYQNVLLLPGG